MIDGAAETTPPERPVRSVGVPLALRVGDRAAGGGFALAVVLMLALLGGMASGYRPLVDHSDSMRPAISAGDLLITRAEPARSVRPGQIVSFKDPALAGKLVTHRVVSIHRSGARFAVVTKGDANSASESWSVPLGATIPTLVVRVPAVGRTITWIADPLVRTTLLTLAALVLSVALLRRIWRP